MPRGVKEPFRDTKVEAWLNSKGVQWEYVADIGFEQIDVVRSLQTQARFNALDPIVVTRYANALRNGDQFPPIVLHKRGRGKLVNIDGNHRVAGAQEAGLDGFPSGGYLVTADAKTVALMTMEANTRHGLPTSTEERVSHAIYYIDNGASIEQAAASLQVPIKEIKKALAKVRANQRAEDAGILRSQWDKLQPSVRGRLVNIGTDEGLKAAADLAFRADLDFPLATELVAALNAVKSAAKQKAICADFERQWADRIQASGGGSLTQGNSRKGFTPRQRFMGILTTMSQLPEDLTTLADSIAEQEAPELADRLGIEIARLTAFKEKLEARSA